MQSIYTCSIHASTCLTFGKHNIPVYYFWRVCNIPIYCQTASRVFYHLLKPTSAENHNNNGQLLYKGSYVFWMIDWNCTNIFKPRVCIRLYKNVTCDTDCGKITKSLVGSCKFTLPLQYIFEYYCNFPWMSYISDGSL